MTKTNRKPAMPEFSIQAANDNKPQKPTPERLAMAGEAVDVIRDTGAVRLSDSPVERLHRSGHITDAQLKAAQRLYADWYAAGMAPLGAVDYERSVVDGSKGEAASDRRYAALQRYNGAMKELNDASLGEIVDRVVLREMSLTEAGVGLRWVGESQRRAVAGFALEAGLQLLVKRWGLE